jgi:ATP-dependent DNA helicase RecQ
VSDENPVHDPLEVLERVFGHRRFLDGQSRIVSALLGGRDALAVMPTGGGKSLCYQLPALLMDGVTVVVSPLIALMKDQVDALVRRGVAATVINSTIGQDEQRARIAAMRRGEWKLVYIAPERFRQRAFVEALKSADIALFAVDEAHCISQWGHDFRPDYQRLGEALEMLGRPQVVALTATATPEVRADIVRQLGFTDHEECISGFARPNLSLNVTACARVRDKYERLRSVVEQYGTGVVYCATRGKVEEVAEAMEGWGVQVIAYHGGLKEDERARLQDEFISRKAAVAVATNAFGMGIDRSDVRFVVHFEIPGSLEAYYQEAGRAGRDGEPGWCELLYNYADTRTQEFFIDGNNPGAEMIRGLYQVLLNRADGRHEVMASIEQLSEWLGNGNGMAVGSAISVLVRHGMIERFDVPGQRIRGTRLKRPGVKAGELELDRAALEEKDRRDRDKLRRMISWADARVCRQRMILEYFGESGAADCGNCDVCRAGSDRLGAREATAEELTVVRKLLSGVARCSVRGAGGWEGRFGRARIAGMLTGSRSREVLSARLDELSTYGALREWGQAFVLTLFRELESAGYLQTSGGEYPMVTLTEAGVQMMKSGGSLRLNWPSSVVSPVRESGGGGVAGGVEVRLAEVGFDEGLYRKLRECRTAMAAREGVPAYVIFNNQTLEFLTRLRPQTMAEGLRVRGIGEGKAKRYLEPFLEILRQHR